MLSTSSRSLAEQRVKTRKACKSDATVGTPTALLTGNYANPPDRSKFEIELATLQDELKVLQQRQAALSVQLSQCNNGKHEYLERKAAFRSQIDAINREIDALVEEKSSLKFINTRTRLDHNTTAPRALQRFLANASRTKIEERIANADRRLMVETLTLKDEKQLLADMQEMKRHLRQCKNTSTASSDSVMQHAPVSVADLEESLAKLCHERRNAQQQLATLTESRTKELNVIPELIKRRNELSQQVENKLWERSALRKDFRQQERDFNAHLAKQREERRRKSQEEQTAREAELKALQGKTIAERIDETHHHVREISMLEQAISLMKRLQKSSGVVCTQREDGSVHVHPEDDEFVIRKENRKAYYIEPSVKATAKAKKRRRKHGHGDDRAQKPLKHNAETIRVLQELQLDAPKTLDGIPAVLEQLECSLATYRRRSKAWQSSCSEIKRTILENDTMNETSMSFSGDDDMCNKLQQLSVSLLDKMTLPSKSISSVPSDRMTQRNTRQARRAKTCPAFELPKDDPELVMDNFLSPIGSAPRAPCHEFETELGVRIDGAEFRAMRLEQLRELSDLIQRRCVSEEWTDPFPTISGEANVRYAQPILPECVNLYQLAYHLILPASVPRGVTLVGLPRCRQCTVDSEVRQANNPTPHPGAAVGRITSVETVGARINIGVAVDKGCFTREHQKHIAPNLEANHVTIEGTALGYPHAVIPVEHWSYMERVSCEPQLAQTYCSHFWGEPVLEFIACCEKHCDLRHSGDARVTYWCCAYANRQHELAMEIVSNPEETTFGRALRQSHCLLLILDAMATPFQRIWCGFEIFQALRDTDKLLDVVAMDARVPRLLADGREPLQNKAALDKRLDEKKFPIGILTEGLRRRLEDGQASVEIDKIRILNCMRGHADLDDREILKAVALDGEARQWFQNANQALHAMFAISSWPRSVADGLVEDFDGTGELRLPKILADDHQRKHLVLNLSYTEEMTDAHLKALASGFPPNLDRLILDFAGCHQVSSAGLIAFAQALPMYVTCLHLNFEDCVRITSKGLETLALHLPTCLTHLSLRLCAVKDQGWLALAQNLPETLRFLQLHFGTLVTDVGGSTFVKQLPVNIQYLSLHFEDCYKVTTRTLQELLAHLPSSVKHLALAFCQIGDIGLTHLASQFPQDVLKLRLRLGDSIGDDGLLAFASASFGALMHLSLDLYDCRRVSDKGLKALATGLPRHLQQLILDLRRSSVNVNGLVALAAGMMPALSELHVEIGSEGFYDGGLVFSAPEELTSWAQSFCMK